MQKEEGKNSVLAKTKELHRKGSSQNLIPLTNQRKVILNNELTTLMLGHTY